MTRVTRAAGLIGGVMVLSLGCGSSGRGAGPGSGGRGGTGGGGGGTGGISGTGGMAGGGTGGSASGGAGTGGSASGGAATGGSSTGGAATGGGGGGGGQGGAADYPLGMNDVTILAPLSTSSATPVLLRGTDLADDGMPFVPRALFDRLVKDSELSQPLLTVDAHNRLHLIAVRFDLCDRHLPGECPSVEDGRLRLVFQPIFADGNAEDVGFHAFYNIRNDEIDAAVVALRELARLAPPQRGALRVSPALSATSAQPYATLLRAFVRKYGGETRLIRLTMNAQPEIFAQVRWELRGVEKKGDAFVDMAIVGSTAISESILTDATAFTVTPVVDVPAGLAGALTARVFEPADPATKRSYLTALVSAENPLAHSAETVPCVACHVSTFVMNARAPIYSIDPLMLPGRYTSKYDLSTMGGKSVERQVTRALGYIARTPLISQRVVNDTAQTLAELEKRYPAP